MRITTRLSSGAAVAAVLICFGQLTSAPAQAGEELHNVTYIARIDGLAPGSTVTFRVNGTETNTAPLSALPGNTFEAHTVLADPDEAGLRVSIPWPYSVNVHCEVSVDDVVTAKTDRMVSALAANSDSSNGTLVCGAPPSGTGGGAAS